MLKDLLVLNLVVVAGFVIGCATLGDGQPPTDNIDPVLLEYRAPFEKDMKKYTNKVSNRIVALRFVDDMRGKRVGECLKVSYGKLFISYHISIKRPFWNRISKCRKKLLMYHEFGHCIMDLDHMPEKSVMQPQLMKDDSFCGKDKEKYLKQLFGVDK